MNEELYDHFYEIEQIATVDTIERDHITLIQNAWVPVEGTRTNSWAEIKADFKMYLESRRTSTIRIVEHFVRDISTEYYEVEGRV